MQIIYAGCIILGIIIYCIGGIVAVTSFLLDFGDDYETVMTFQRLIVHIIGIFFLWPIVIYMALEERNEEIRKRNVETRKL